MKNLIFISGFLCLFQLAYSQKIIEKSFQSSGIKSLKLEFKMGQTIRVTTWNKNQVYFKASVDLNNGKLNDSLKIDYQQNGMELAISSTINGKFNNWMSKKNFVKWQSQNVPFYWDNKENFVVAEIIYELKIPKGLDLNIESINADIELRGVENRSKIKTINGFVDMDWNEVNGADLLLKTINGEIYSDMEIQFSNFKKFSIVGYGLRGKYNNGGTNLELESINGDIFFRKIM